jgi:hypothetical protein
MKRLVGFVLLASVSAAVVAACGANQFPTVTIYETPARYVRLELDRTVKKGAGHTHPISITPEQVAAVLGGVRVIEPLAKLPLYDDTSLPRVHQAFTEKEITFFAPLLALALSKATPEEVVTFYQSRDISAIARQVTSGGVFVRGEELHLILANYRSRSNLMADMGVADTQDDRMTPMESLNPQLGRVDFEPYSAKRERPVGALEKLFESDHRELAVLYKQLPPRPLVQPALQPESIP